MSGEWRRTPDGSILYFLERKRVKNVNLRVRRDGSVSVSAPPHVPLAAVERFLFSRAAWIAAARARQEAAQEEKTPVALQNGDRFFFCGRERTLSLMRAPRAGVQCAGERLILSLPHPEDEAARRRVFLKFLKEEASRVFAERIRAFAPLFYPNPREVPSLSVRWMRSRWGSCTPAKNRITLNLKLLFVPQTLSDYVILHEFCHFRVLDHSPAFYRALAAVCPDHAAFRRALAAAKTPSF